MSDPVASTSAQNTAATGAVQTAATEATKAVSWVTAEELWFRNHQYISGLISGGLIVAVIAIAIAVIAK